MHAGALGERALYVPLLRSLSGFRLIDLALSGPCTLIAPVDGAFDALPWSFERLFADDRLIHPRFDLFEYLAAFGHADPSGPVTEHPTFQGETIRIGEGRVEGPRGAACILASIEWNGVPVHAVDACVLPSTLGRELWPS